MKHIIFPFSVSNPCLSCYVPQEYSIFFISFYELTYKKTKLDCAREAKAA